MTSSPGVLADFRTFAQAIVDTIHEPFLVLDAELRVLSASRSFYETFKVDRHETQTHRLYILGNGQWDIPSLRLLLETLIAGKLAMNDVEVAHDFPMLGHRVMLLNARRFIDERTGIITILLAFRDLTANRASEDERNAILNRSDQLVQQNELLLDEMRHRIANSLQIIASILMLKARAVSSAETRFHLNDAHARVMSVAVVQEHLRISDGIEQVEIANYLEELCKGLANSMVGESQPVAIKVTADRGMIPPATAVSLGLIVTELVINALKHAFVKRKEGAEIQITYKIDGTDWRLDVVDNGAGKGAGSVSRTPVGLGTTIVSSIAKQLGATVHTTSSPQGLAIAISRATFTSRQPAPTF